MDELKTRPTAFLRVANYYNLFLTALLKYVLQLHNPDLPFELQVGASKVGVGTILPNKITPFSYFSCKLSHAVHASDHSDAGHGELLPKFALGEWRHWLEGLHISSLFYK